MPDRLMRLLARFDYLLGEAGDWPVVVAAVIAAAALAALYMTGNV